MPNKKIVLRKLKEILENLQLLKELKKSPLSEIQKSKKEMLLIERLLERTIGAAIDINMHILSGSKHAVPPTYRDSFLILARNGFLPEKLGAKLADSASFRNILVHEYVEINPNRLYQTMKEAVLDYENYIRHIEKLIH